MRQSSRRTRVPRTYKIMKNTSTSTVGSPTKPHAKQLYAEDPLQTDAASMIASQSYRGLLIWGLGKGKGSRKERNFVFFIMSPA